MQGTSSPFPSFLFHCEKMSIQDSISKVLKLSYRSIIRHLIAKVLYYDYKIGIILNFSIRLHYTSDMRCHRTVL